MDNTQTDTPDQLRLVSENRGLQARGLGKYFGQKRVVRNISIGVRRGEAVGLLGPNGAGKTTTFYMLSGLIPCDEGAIFMDGMDVTDTPLFQRARMGLAASSGPDLRPDGRKKYSFRSEITEKRLICAMRCQRADGGVCIGHLRNTPVNLSGGERRRLEIARALAAQPAFCCWMNRLPVLIPSLSPIYAILSLS